MATPQISLTNVDGSIRIRIMDISVLIEQGMEPDPWKCAFPGAAPICNHVIEPFPDLSLAVFFRVEKNFPV
jgi:hypothetical protein